MKSPNLQPLASARASPSATDILKFYLCVHDPLHVSITLAILLFHGHYSFPPVVTRTFPDCSRCSDPQPAPLPPCLSARLSHRPPFSLSSGPVDPNKLEADDGDLQEEHRKDSAQEKKPKGSRMGGDASPFAMDNRDPNNLNPHIQVRLLVVARVIRCNSQPIPRPEYTGVILGLAVVYPEFKLA